MLFRVRTTRARRPYGLRYSSRMSSDGRRRAESLVALFARQQQAGQFPGGRPAAPVRAAHPARAPDLKSGTSGLTGAKAGWSISVASL